MTAAGLRRRIAALALAGAALAAVPSCSKSPTEPEPRPVVHRTVTAVLRDSLGNPLPSETLVWTSQFAVDGLITIFEASTDAEGECAVVLAEGGWCVATRPGPHSAGGSLVVSGPGRAASDTQLVRLIRHTSSRVTGTITLAGRVDHSGTIVTPECGGLAVTDPSGTWIIDGLPLGRWQVNAYQLGFRPAVAIALVTTPGSVVSVPAVQLLSDP